MFKKFCFGVLVVLAMVVSTAPDAFAGGVGCGPACQAAKQAAAAASAAAASAVVAKYVEWGNAPIACLPDRAEKWGQHKSQNYGEKSACYCPPAKDFCPNFEIKKSDITFSFTLSYYGETAYPNIPGDDPDLGPYEIADIMKPVNVGKNSMFLKKILRPYIMKKTNNKVDVTMFGGNSHAAIYVDIAADKENKLESKDMPLEMMSRCCESICPVGLTLEQQKITHQNYEYKYSDTAQLEEELHQAENIDKLLQGVKSNLTNSVYKAVLEGILLDTKGKTNEQILEIINSKVSSFGAKPIPSGVNVVDSILGDLYPYFRSGDLPTTAQISTLIDKNGNQVNQLKTTLASHYDADGMPIMVPTDTETVTGLFCVVHAGSILRSGCLAEGTEITTAAGDKVAVQKLKVGDVIRTDKGESKVAALNRFTQEHDVLFGVNGGKAFITIEHPILTKAGWKAIDPAKTSPNASIGVLGKLEVGDVILAADGEIEVKSIEEYPVDGNATAYNLSVEDGGALLANDMFVSGFKKVEIHY